MELSESERNLILKTHDSLWNALYDYDSTYYCLEYRDEIYDIRVSPSRDYASVILPSKSGNPILWITQNLNKSTYGAIAIAEARRRNLDLRITWLVDNSNSQFKYKAQVKTCYNDIGDITDSHIEVYDSYGTDVLWSTNSYFTRRKAMF